jgi:hypothetical protein
MLKCCQLRRMQGGLEEGQETALVKPGVLKKGLKNPAIRYFPDKAPQLSWCQGSKGAPFAKVEGRPEILEAFRGKAPGLRMGRGIQGDIQQAPPWQVW